MKKLFLAPILGIFSLLSVNIASGTTNYEKYLLTELSCRTFISCQKSCLVKKIQENATSTDNNIKSEAKACVTTCANATLMDV